MKAAVRIQLPGGHRIETFRRLPVTLPQLRSQSWLPDQVQIGQVWNS